MLFACGGSDVGGKQIPPFGRNDNQAWDQFTQNASGTCPQASHDGHDIWRDLRRVRTVEFEVAEAESRKPALLLWREISPARADLQVFLECRDFDRAIASVRIKIRRLVGDHVLAAQFVFNRGE